MMNNCNLPLCKMINPATEAFQLKFCCHIWISCIKFASLCLRLEWELWGNQNLSTMDNVSKIRFFCAVIDGTWSLLRNYFSSCFLVYIALVICLVLIFENWDYFKSKKVSADLKRDSLAHMVIRNTICAIRTALLWIILSVNLKLHVGIVQYHNYSVN